MSGALNSVFGGGNIFGALLSVASIAFPPLAVAGSLSNLLTAAIGQGVKQAVSILASEFGLPKFVQSLVNDVVNSVVGQQTKPSEARVDRFVAERFGDTLNKLQSELSDAIVSNVSRKLASGSGSEKTSSRSWLAAIAEALGQILGDKAARLVELSSELAELNASGQEISAEMKGMDNKSSQYGDLSNEKADNAREFNRVQAEFQGTSQEYSLLSNTFANAIKSIGEGLTTMGRKG